MSRLHHQHFTPVAPLPGEPDLFQNYADARTDLERLTEPASTLTIFDGVVKTAPYLIEPPSVSVDTSRLAAARIQGRTNRLREAVILFIRAQGARGATAGEIEIGLGLSGSTVRPRLREAEGTAPWCKGRLPARIQRSPEVREHMHVYRTIP